ncbi:hypothetical protein SXCC_00231 [Gluconacetobacter sp. SXCC-1]|nr:hypothetical protein SXCC_00231 [Gluconacetobacter sp. SXCC-1]
MTRHILLSAFIPSELFLLCRNSDDTGFLSFFLTRCRFLASCNPVSVGLNQLAVLTYTLPAFRIADRHHHGP